MLSNTSFQSRIQEKSTSSKDFEWRFVEKRIKDRERRRVSVVSLKWGTVGPIRIEVEEIRSWPQPILGPPARSGSSR